MAVNTESSQYNAMKEAGSWDLCADLLGGTKVMRAAGTTWLPQESEEEDKNYNVRVGRSFLFNAYRNTIDKYVSRPFSRPATWDVKNNPEAKTALEPVMADMDGEGQTHQDYAREWLRAMLEWGPAHSYADYPQIDDPKGITKADEQRDDIKPVNKIMNAPQVIGWKTEEQTNGSQKIVEIRVKEVYVQDGEDWGQTVYEQIRVITATKWELYRKETEKNGKKIHNAKWSEVPVEEGAIVINGKESTDIPLVTIYAEKWAQMMALPPFLDMAWTNLELWQSSSDQKNILRFDRLGILFAAGFEDEDIKKGIKVAPTQAISTSNENATLSRVETNGAPAENGWKDIRDIMERLEIQGSDPMVQRMANVKAAGINANENKSRSEAESWVSVLARGMRQLMQWDLRWMGFEVDLEDIEYNIHQDFVFGTAIANEIKSLIEMRKMGDIAQIDFLKEMQRYAVLMDSDVAELAARAQTDQGRGVGMFGENRISQPGTPAAADVIAAQAAAAAAGGTQSIGTPGPGI